MSRRVVRDRAGGFTLVELLISSTITIMAIALALSMFSGQQSALRRQDLMRGNAEAARDALLEMESALRRAGYGIDPRYAFDFGSYRCASPGQCRDRIDGPDELVFVSRDPNYRWTSAAGGRGRMFNLVSHASGAFVLEESSAGTAPKILHKGRVLLAFCNDGSEMSMQTVSATTEVNEGGSVTLVPLLSPVADDPYRDPNIDTAACFHSGTALIFLVDRHRYAIQVFDGVSYLVLDTGLDLDDDGSTPAEGDDDDLLPVTAGVDDLQVAYLLDSSPGFTAPDSDANWIVGDTAGVGEEMDPTAAAPDYRTALNDASRFNLHPANVRGVRLSLGLHSSVPDTSQAQTWRGDPLRLLENRTSGLSSLGRFRRSTARSTVTLRNLESRSPFIF